MADTWLNSVIVEPNIQLEPLKLNVKDGFASTITDVVELGLCTEIQPVMTASGPILNLAALPGLTGSGRPSSATRPE